MKILVQNLKIQAFFGGGIAWTEDIDRAFDFKSRTSAQDFCRENGLLHVAVVRCRRETTVFETAWETQMCDCARRGS